MFRDVCLRPSCRLRLGTAVSPAPAGEVDPGAPLTVIVTVAPGHPGNRVDLAWRLDAGRAGSAHAVPTLVRPDGQSFTAHLPPLSPGQRLDYRAELRRAGQLVAAMPEGGGWQSVTAAAAPKPAASGSTAPARDAAVVPRFGYALDFLAAVTIQLRAEVIGQTPEGYRVNFYVVDGEARGPRLNARIRPQGGDWMCIRPDGVGELDIRVTYETSDGALLLERSGGVFNIGAEGYADVLRGIYAGAPPLSMTPAFITADPRWQWINALQCVGFGRVAMRELRVECDLYATRLDGAPPLG